MIKSFKSKETEKVFHRHYSMKLPSNIQEIAFRKLRMLNRAQTINDLRVPPGNRLEALREDRAGQHSIRINDSGEYVFNGKKAINMTLKLLTIIRSKNIYEKK